MSDTKLPPLPQSYYDENRERFSADSSALDIDKLSPTCKHFIERISFNEVKCRNCQAGWYDMNRFELDNGKIKSVR